MQNFGPVDTFGNTYVPQFTDYQLEEAELKTALSRRDTQLVTALNLKTNGIYETVETQTGEQFFGSLTNQQKKRFSFRKVFSFGAIAAGASLVITLGITGITQFTHIYGTCVTDAPDFRPIPHASVTANANIEVIVSATTITINNGAAGPNIVSGLIVLEYLKQ